MCKKLLFLSALLGVAQGALATNETIVPPILGHPEVVAPANTRVFTNTPELCGKNATCDLRQIIFRKRDYASPPEEGITIVGSEFFAGFEVNEIPALSRYVFVQFTRGCMWDSYQNADGSILTEFGVLRNFQGFYRIQHVLPKWTVDSNDTDPVYGADIETGNRMFYLQTADSIPLGIPRAQGKLLGEVPATIPFGYITDMPGPGTYSTNLKWAKNMSLEYKTCLFRATDVPRTVGEVEFAITEKAIDCFDWGVKKVYDHKALDFVSHEGIHAECRRPFSEFEKKFHLRQFEPKEPPLE